MNTSQKLTQYSFFLFLLMFLSGCLPETPARRVSSNDLDNGNGGTTPPVDETIEDALHWFSSGSKSQILTLNSNNQNTVFVRGREAHNFLSSAENYTKSYCMTVTFVPANGTPKEYRFRMIPSNFVNYTTNKTERYFRANVDSSSGNQSCNQNISDSSGNIITPGAIANSTMDICPACFNIFESDRINLYEVVSDNFGSQFLTPVEALRVPTTTLTLRINQNNDTTGPIGSCTDSNCRALGYDCCIDGQCALNKSIKSSVDQTSSEFQAAHLLRLTNPSWYLDYPQYYYACLNTPPTTGPGDGGGSTTGNGGTTPEEEAAALLQRMNNDYLCIEELKTNSENDPFHSEPYNGNPSDYSKCNVTTSSDNMFYETVMKRMYTNCGCAASDFSDMVSNCPKYTYKQVFSNNKLVRIECVTPQPDINPPPFQDTNVTVSSKTAPHRFFNTDGVEVNLEKVGSITNTTVEGQEFFYNDDTTLFPQNGVFNMNSLMGRMDVSLTHAIPAKMIDIDYDKTYFIGVTQGLYTSCPSCSKDSWFANFTAFPTTHYGTGLQASGYTTARDAWGTNSTLGNYEDTIFGRACFVPPTMLPFSHDGDATSQSQRQNRLKTQSFMYVNGYQRDWYGFNKGALIGSFDGVSWFAVGKGRIAKSTSTKLFLAINAPFADLAQNNQHVVTVQAYDFMSTAANSDYDFGISPQDARQNEAGSCQQWHSCSVDRDCISKLGWEYACADVTTYQTQWPEFETTGAKEIAGSEKLAGIHSILNQGQLTGSSTKRCVYRGAGAPCQANYNQITDVNKRRALSCAPNFYCASVDTNDAVFNTEVSRFAESLEVIIDSKNHLFGQDANVLGRPRHYITGGGLTNLQGAQHADVRANLKANLSKMSTASSNQFGICRPGKLLPEYATATQAANTKPLNQHQARDTQRRTDFISQISGCNSALYLPGARYSSCPIIDADGNYAHFRQDFLNDNFQYKSETLSQDLTSLKLGTVQNACGMESLATGTTYGMNVSPDTVWQNSTLKNIESRTLASSDVVSEPKFARDACFRRAGSVCHTDLDCSPNKVMADQVELMNPAWFGNLAERSYYQEYLVCGQAKKEPVFGSGTYYEYDMSQNRCCRPVGQTVTLYTEDTPGLPESTGLRTDLFGAYNPSNEKRYSRYSNVEKAKASNTSLQGIIRPSANSVNDGANLVNAVNILNSNQWRTISESAGKTCCGGGWVRKFADGTTNWAKTDRLAIDETNFTCINYQHPLMKSTIATNAFDNNLTRSQLDRDRLDFCVDPTGTEANCAQVNIDSSGTLGSTRQPRLNATDGRMIVNTLPTWNQWSDNLWSLAPLRSNDSVSLTYLDWSRKEDEVQRKNVSLYIPAWIPIRDDIEVSLQNPDSDSFGVCDRSMTEFAFTDALDHDEATSSNCRYSITSTPAPVTARYLKVVHNANAYINIATSFEKRDLAVQIRFVAPGTRQWEADNSTGLAYNQHKRSSEPGDYFYYLKRLAKLEYIGIPQMTYEPIYCNTNYQELVPGIFNSTVKTVHDFINNPDTFLDPSGQKPWQTDTTAGAMASINAEVLNRPFVATQKLLAMEPVFSANEFQCCSKLGQSVDNISQCCTGYAVEDERNDSNNTTYICKLPPGADLNVYFNRFVSSEGTEVTTAIVNPLVDADFEPKTGEPKLNSEVLQKLTALGNAHCDSNRVRRGAAFGEFAAEPFGSQGQHNSGGPKFGIVDSAYDDSQAGQVDVGYTKFHEGFRWNHHIYCDFE